LELLSASRTTLLLNRLDIGPGGCLGSASPLFLATVAPQPQRLRLLEAAVARVRSADLRQQRRMLRNGAAIGPRGFFARLAPAGAAALAGDVDALDALLRAGAEDRACARLLSVSVRCFILARGPARALLEQSALRKDSSAAKTINDNAAETGGMATLAAAAAARIQLAAEANLAALAAAEAAISAAGSQLASEELSDEALQTLESVLVARASGWLREL